MSFHSPNDGKKDDTHAHGRKTLPLIRKPVSSKMFPGSTNLFDSREIETHSTNYDINIPGNNTTMNMLQLQNPGLLVFRKKADHFREKELIHPETSTSPKLVASSLLVRRPLGKLKDPLDIPVLDTVQQKKETEKASLAFTDDPVAYFSKRKDGRGHLFIYMLYAMDRSDPFFSPYELKKVTSAEIEAGKEYFTMSATGVTLVQPDGNTEHVTLDQWAKASSSFITLRKLKFFSQYFYWKSFRIWKKFVLQNRYHVLQEEICSYPFFKNVNFFSEFMKKNQVTEEQANEEANGNTPTNANTFAPQPAQSNNNNPPKTENNNSNNNNQSPTNNTNKINQNNTNTNNENENAQPEPVENSSLSFLNLQETSDGLLKHYLLSSFQSAKKYPIDEFEQTTKSNIEKLKKEFADFIQNIQEEILQIYDIISDPQHVQVLDSEFPEIRRRNPNLGQLMILEKKKALARNDKTHIVNREIMAIGSYIRLIDYILLETLTKSCISYWRLTELHISDALQAHTIFQVEVLFNDEGQVIFKPKLDDLLCTIEWALDLSIETLNSLPRLIFVPQLRPLLRDNGLNIPQLYQEGPQFLQIINQDKVLDSIKETINQSVTDAYELALRTSQSYTEFYPIYKLGQTWDPRDYIITRNGTKYQGSLQAIPGEGDDEFLLNYMDEPVVDFDRIQKDIVNFKQDEERVQHNKTLASGQSKLALYIDTKFMRDSLIPIPTKALQDLYQILNDLVEYKNNKISSALKFYDKSLKQVPRQLENFVEFCEILQRTIDVTPQIKLELEFVDRMMTLFKTFEITVTTATQKTGFNSFESAKKQAQYLREQSLEDFIGKLKAVVRETERKIDHFYEKATTVPASMKDVDISVKLPSAEKLCLKVEKMSPDIARIVHYQKVIGVELNNFSAFMDVSGAAKFAVRLYKAVAQWQEISKEMLSTPFSHIDIDKFKEDLEKLKTVVSELQSSAKTNYPILTELVTKVNEISPYLDELTLLSKGKMQVRHWNTLFEECNQTNPYNPQITIEDFLQFGILKMKDKIESITATSHGESELEIEFQQISSYWNKVQLPLVEQQIKTDDTVLLAPTNTLIEEIHETLDTLQNMLQLPFVQGVREAVTSLSSTLENITQILDTWKIFQSNWIILSQLFNQEEAKTALPHQANRFVTVQRKWVSIARNTMKDPRLFSVCSFPSLLDILNENNKAMEAILIALGKYLDGKRAAVPRLYFLSNDEVLTLSATNVFSHFSRALPKLFTNVKTFDYKDVDMTEREVSTNHQGLARMKIYGIIAENGDTLPFSKFVSCNAPLETWLSQTIESMKTAVRDKIMQTLQNFTDDSEFSWIYPIPIYIATTVMNILFTSEIDDCFAKFSHNPKSFTNCEHNVGKRITQIAQAFSRNPNPTHFQKLSSLLIQLIGFRDKFSMFSIRSPHISQQFSWKNTLKFKIPTSTNQLMIEFGDCQWEHGYEFWGSVPRLVHTPTLDTTINNFASTIEHDNVPLLCGSATSGRLTIIRELAMEFGRFLFIAYPFPTINEYFMSRILIGAASSGSWVVFPHIDKLSHINLSYLYDNINSFSVAQSIGNPRITISSRLVDLNKNCRILITSDYLDCKMKTFPPQLRSFIRPISLMKPDYQKYVEVRLQSMNFKNSSIIGSKFAFAVTSITQFFHEDLPNKSILSHMTQIVNFLYSVSQKYPNVSSDIIAAYQIYLHFKNFLTEQQTESLLELIHSSFRITDTLQDFSKQINALLDIEFNEKLKEVAFRELNKLNIGIPIEHLVNSIVQLYHTMANSFAIVICGPSNSGKSLILNTLQKCLEDPELIETQPILKPLKIRTLYHASDDQSSMFGHVVNDLSLGQIWSYGQIQAILTNLSTVKKDHTAVLKFDGPVSSSYGRFFCEFLGTNDAHKCQLNSLDSYPTISHFKMIIETESLSDFPPSLIAKCHIISMTNIQISNYKSLADLPLSKALETVSDIPKDSLDTFKSIFVEITPNIINKIRSMNNKINSNDVILNDIFVYYSALIALKRINFSKVELNDEKQVKALIVKSFFSIYSAILSKKDTSAFDGFLRTTYNLDVPPDWVGYTVPDHFWETYQRPSLISLNFFKGKMIPIEYNRVNDEPYIPNSIEGQHPILQEDMIITHAQLLPSLQFCNFLVKNSMNFIINGSSHSGKTTFLKLLFKDIDNAIPVYIQSSEYHSQETILPLISEHTNLITRVKLPITQVRTFALIFENVESTHLNTIEFIRMLIQERKIPIYSKSDQKQYEIQGIDNFFVIITTREYKHLPQRLISKFVPVSLHKLSVPTARFIAKKTMMTYGNDEAQSKDMIKVICQILQQFAKEAIPLLLIKIIYMFCHIETKNNQTANLSVLLGQLYYHVFHAMDPNQYRDKLTFLLKGTFTKEEEVHLINISLEFNTIYYPTFNLSRDLKIYQVKAEYLPIKTVKDDMIQSLNVYNTNSNDKIALRFSKHVLYHISLIHLALNRPGKHILLKGRSGSGRYTLTRFVSNLLEMDFVNISPPSPDEELAEEERILGFYTLLRDIITNTTVHQKRTTVFIRSSPKTLIEERLLFNLASQNNFALFFSKSQLEDLYIRFTGMHQLTYEQRLTAFNQIQSTIRLNLHVVIAQDLADSIFFDSTNFDQIILESDRQEIFKATALESLDGLASRKLISSIKDKIPNLLYKLSEIARSKVKFFHPNMYYDFVDCFAHFAAADYQDVLSMNENIQSALEFLNRLESESHQIDRKLESLLPTLQRLQADSETLLSSYTTRKEAIEIRRAKLDEEHREKAMEVGQLEEEVEEFNSELEIMIPKIEQTQKTVEDLNDNDIETIRITAADPMPSLRLLLEIFCLILDRPRDYERSGQKLLMDPTFVETVVQKVSKMTLSPQLLAIIEPYFEMEALNPDELESIAPSLKSLFDWIECVCKVGITQDKLAKKKKELEDKQRALNDYVEEMNLEKASIEQVEASLENENKSLAASQAAREEMEKEYQSIDAIKQSIGSIFKGIDHFTEKWQDEASKFATKKEKLVGDCIIFSFYLIFCGSMDSETKKQALNQVVGELRLQSIDTNFEDPIQSIRDKFISATQTETILKSDGFISTDTVIESHHVQSTFRTPLLIDPDGIVTNYIISTMRAKRVIVISQNISTLEQTLSTAVNDGKTLILLDADYLHPLITPLMPLDLFTLEQNTVREIRINSKLVTWDPRFRLILISTQNPLTLPSDLLSRVTLIDVSSSSLETTKYLFERVFIDFFNPDLTPKIIQMQQTQLSQRVQISKYEKDTLDILSDIITTQQMNPDYDYLADAETLSDLIKSKDCYFVLVNEDTDFTSLQEEIKTAKQPFRNHVKLCQTFWEVISRTLPQVSKYIKFSFQNYQKQISSVFVNEGLHAGSLTAEQHTVLHNALITSSFQFIFQSLPLTHSFFFLFMASAKLMQLEQKLTNQEFKAILQHIKSEYNGTCDMKLESSETVNDPIEQLKFTNISHIYRYINKFIGEQFGPDFASYLPNFQSDSIISNIATIPTMIIAINQVDPTPLVHAFINTRCRHENFDCVSLSDDLELIRNTRKMIITALNRGNWVLIHYSKANKSAADMLVDIYTQMSSSSVNTNFRLIVLCSTLKYLSPSMLTKSKRINVDLFPSFRNTMLSLYHHNSSIIKSPVNTKAIKKISYAASLLLSSMNYRSFLDPIGFKYRVRSCDWMYKDFITYACSVLDENSEKIPFDNLQTKIKSLLYSAVFDKHDAKVIQSQIEDLITPEALEDGFSPCPETEEEENWAFPPGDMPVSNYSQQIQQISLAPSTMILKMNQNLSMPILDWKLSRWISKPFLKHWNQTNVKKNDFQSIYAKIDNFAMLLPEKLAVSDKDTFEGLNGLSLIHEVRRINDILSYLHQSLDKMLNEIKLGIISDNTDSVSKGVVPSSWKSYCDYYMTNQTNKFATYLIEKHQILLNWVKNGVPRILDVRYIHNLRNILISFLSQQVLKNNGSADSFELHFKFVSYGTTEEEAKENNEDKSNKPSQNNSAKPSENNSNKPSQNTSNQNTSRKEGENDSIETSSNNETTVLSNTEEEQENENTARSTSPKIDGPSEDELLLTKFTLVAGGITNGKLSIRASEKNNTLKPFRNDINLLVSAHKKIIKESHDVDEQDETFTVFCPLYKSALIGGLNKTHSQIEGNEGIPNDFIWDIRIESDQPQKVWTDYGTCFVCNVPEQLA